MLGIFGGKVAGIFESQIDSDKEDEKAKDDAAKVAIKKFKDLGEDVNKSDLEILRIQRKGELYYYISSKDNTVEVRIKDNKITRVNSVPVE